MTMEPWSDPKFHDNLNAQYGLSYKPRPMEPDRFMELQRRLSEILSVDRDALDVEPARELLKDASGIAREMIEGALYSNANAADETPVTASAAPDVVGKLAECVSSMADCITAQGDQIVQLAGKGNAT